MEKEHNFAEEYKALVKEYEDLFCELKSKIKDCETIVA